MRVVRGRVLPVDHSLRPRRASRPEGQGGPPQGNLESQPGKLWMSGLFPGFGGSTDGENVGHKNRADQPPE